MKTVWTFEVDEILKVGYQLTNIGLHNWALPKLEALNALEKLEAIEVPVLGGDVCQNIDGVMKPNYDNWHCERLTRETKKEFVSRRIQIAKNYIGSYPLKKNHEI